MSKPTELGSLKIGSYILLPVSDQPTGDPCRLTEYDTSKPGKHGSAKARIVGVGTVSYTHLTLPTNREV